MPVAKPKNKTISKTAKTTKKARSTKATQHHGLSWKKIAAIVFVPVFAITALAVGLKVSYATTQAVTYNSIVEPISDDTPLVNFESRHIAEFGSQVSLAGTDRLNSNVTILMNSMACQTGTWQSGCVTATPGASFSHPMTLRVYNVDPTKPDSIGDLVTSVEKTFAVPFRPTSDGCNGTNTMWTDADGNCHASKSFTVDFSLGSVKLPDNAIVTIAYNTTHEGLEPLGGTGGPYDYLAVAGVSAPSVGTILPGSGDAYVSYSPAAGTAYCDQSAGTTTLRLDPFGFCWYGSVLGLRITSDSVTTPPPVVVPPAPDKPKTADDCKKDNWKVYTPAFKNQGQCVSSVVPLK
jgi:hypothetical protein